MTEDQYSQILSFKCEAGIYWNTSVCRCNSLRKPCVPEHPQFGKSVIFTISFFPGRQEVLRALRDDWHLFQLYCCLTVTIKRAKRELPKLFFITATRNSRTTWNSHHSTYIKTEIKWTGGCDRTGWTEVSVAKTAPELPAPLRGKIHPAREWLQTLATIFRRQICLPRCSYCPSQLLFFLKGAN